MAQPPSSPTNALPESALRLPANKRLSTPNSLRLSTILEGRAKNRSSADQQRPATDSAAPPLPHRSPWRILAYTSNNHASRTPESSAQSSIRTAPPPYTWVSNPDETDLRAPVEGEKVAALRRGEKPKKQRRGGWKRLALLLVLALLVIVGLAVGLGVGLTVRKTHESNGEANGSSGGADSTSVAQAFPLGEYSMEAYLRSVTTDCTSNAATWRCYPYSTYDPGNASSLNNSVSIFNWIITNTSETYASNTTSALFTTPSSGVPANLTLSSTNNPFSITFTNQSLTYHADSSNSSSPYYSFSFSMEKNVYPTVALTSDEAATECFFNETIFSARLYLAAKPTISGTSVSGGYTPWPFALDIAQTSPSGENVPACYTLNNGKAGARITTGLSVVTGDTECACNYANY